MVTTKKIQKCQKKGLRCFSCFFCMKLTSFLVNHCRRPLGDTVDIEKTCDLKLVVKFIWILETLIMGYSWSNLEGAYSIVTETGLKTIQRNSIQ